VIHGPGPGAWAGQASPPTTGAPRPLNRRRAEDLDGTRGTLLVGPAGGAVDGTDADFRGAKERCCPPAFSSRPDGCLALNGSFHWKSDLSLNYSAVPRGIFACRVLFPTSTPDLRRSPPAYREDTQKHTRARTLARHLVARSLNEPGLNPRGGRLVRRLAPPRRPRIGRHPGAPSFSILHPQQKKPQSKKGPRARAPPPDAPPMPPAKKPSRQRLEREPLPD